MEIRFETDRTLSLSGLEIDSTGNVFICFHSVFTLINGVEQMYRSFFSDQSFNRMVF